MELSTDINDFINKNPHMQFISDLNKAIEANSLTMIYEGRIDQEVIKSIASSIEKKMNQEIQSFKVKKVIFQIAIEMLQNISKYSDDEITGKGIIILGKAPDGYYLSSGNVIFSEKAPELSSKLATLNKLNKDGLEKLYESQVSIGGFNSKGGAGLGLIDILRKSKQKLQYSFEVLNNNRSFFLLTATILKEN